MKFTIAVSALATLGVASAQFEIPSCSVINACRTAWGEEGYFVCPVFPEFNDDTPSFLRGPPARTRGGGGDRGSTNYLTQSICIPFEQNRLGVVGDRDRHFDGSIQELLGDGEALFGGEIEGLILANGERNGDSLPNRVPPFEGDRPFVDGGERESRDGERESSDGGEVVRSKDRRPEDDGEEAEPKRDSLGNISAFAIEPHPGCPEETPELHSPCNFEGPCEYETDTCCDGTTYPKKIMICEDGSVLGFFRDGCLGIVCNEYTMLELTLETEAPSTEEAIEEQERYGGERRDNFDGSRPRTWAPTEDGEGKESRDGWEVKSSSTWAPTEDGEGRDRRDGWEPRKTWPPSDGGEGPESGDEREGRDTWAPREDGEEQERRDGEERYFRSDGGQNRDESYGRGGRNLSFRKGNYPVYDRKGADGRFGKDPEGGPQSRLAGLGEKRARGEVTIPFPTLQCGCCGGDCPAPLANDCRCACDINLPYGTVMQGVKVAVFKPDGGVVNKCVPPGYADLDKATCIQECSVEVENHFSF